MSAVLVTDPVQVERLKSERVRGGHDWRDEVWDGVYVMAPAANNEHERITKRLWMVLHTVVDARGLGESCTPVNVSDRDEGWKGNYREPDLSVYLAGNPAVDHGTHWQGGGDFVVEILSPGDPARRKKEFYAAVGVRELLIVDRHPWALEMYRTADGRLERVGESTVDGAEVLTSAVLPLTFRLVPGDDRPRIEVAHAEGGEPWII